MHNFENPRRSSVLGRYASVWAGAGVLIAATTTLGVTSCGSPEEFEDVAGSYQALGTPTTASFQSGLLPSSSYAGTHDATIRQTAPSANYGSEVACEADGDDTDGADESCVIRWDISGIPAGSTVQLVTITLHVTNASTDTYQLYGLKRAWSESEVTWQNTETDSLWANAGALGSTDRGASIGTMSGAAGSRSVSLNASGVALVQSWVDGGTNAGIIIANSSNADGLGIGTSERTAISERPRLDITYLPPNSDTGTGGSGTGSGGDTGGIATDPNLKIAFIGDTATGTNFRNVLNLVQNEGAAALVVQGDMSYSANPTTWWSDVESVLGTTFPVFISRGNHDDSSWSGYQAKANAHLGGATRSAGAHDAHYKTTFRGLAIATIKKGDGASRINSLLSGDAHIWKICQWHQNQAAMQVGGKTDEMGWDVYEACRQQGAIIQTGHEHNYSRSKTLTNMTSQLVDPSCSGANQLCVGPGRTFANVVGLGGNSIRPQLRCLPATAPYGCNGVWGSIYTSDQGATHGAQFIVFNAGAPKSATGYFKNVNGQIVDTFRISHD